MLPKWRFAEFLCGLGDRNDRYSSRAVICRSWPGRFTEEQRLVGLVVHTARGAQEAGDGDHDPHEDRAEDLLRQ